MMKLKNIEIINNGLKPFKIPPGLVLVQDTREQQPLFAVPQDGLEVVSGTLPHGDYSIKGFEQKFVIERKKISDFFSFNNEILFKSFERIIPVGKGGGNNFQAILWNSE
jgi:ERCC4-type nuclease